MPGIRNRGLIAEWNNGYIFIEIHPWPWTGRRRMSVTVIERFEWYVSQRNQGYLRASSLALGTHIGVGVFPSIQLSSFTLGCCFLVSVDPDSSDFESLAGRVSMGIEWWSDMALRSWLREKHGEHAQRWRHHWESARAQICHATAVSATTQGPRS